MNYEEDYRCVHCIEPHRGAFWSDVMGGYTSCCYKGKKSQKTGDRAGENVSFRPMKKTYH